jgi:hypothetical protein
MTLTLSSGFSNTNPFDSDKVRFSVEANGKVEKSLDVYFDGISFEEMKEMKKRFYLWRAFQCFQWFNVAMFKDLVGMSETLKLDFKMIALSYLKQIEENLNKVKKLEK